MNDALTERTGLSAALASFEPVSGRRYKPGMRSPRATDRARPPSGATREIILDAAEKVFAERGFHATTIREVFKEAGLNSGLMTYYFSSKDELFTQAVMRRHGQLKEKFTRLFDAPSASGKVPRSAEECVGLYLRFFFETAFSSDSDLRHYVLLLANSASVFEEALVASLLGNFDFITDRMLMELNMAIPDAHEGTLREGLFYLESAVTTILLTERFRRTRLAHLETTELQSLWRSMAHFFAQGTLALTSRNPAHHAALASVGEGPVT
ncbi:TetR/AcrR family transcriptional regulator [Sphingomonas profundi]|uniref:TetR/AcrR family transcriptional regulator n=1 Tax=Alterirhizorhabdus profundi TaxID=2681549 RepID=UPI0012E84573|nr:TetR/AcrR family transcriptional regulator [Sphingomonas profundi]